MSCVVTFLQLLASTVLVFLTLLHPKTIVEGCLYLKGNWLLWSVYDGLLWSGHQTLMVYGIYDHVPI